MLTEIKSELYTMKSYNTRPKKKKRKENNIEFRVLKNIKSVTQYSFLAISVA